MNVFDPNAASLTAEQCPIPNFDEMKGAVHEALCGIDQRSLERDSLLLAEHQALVKKVAAMDPADVSDVIKTLTDFVDGLDTDGDGKIDGLAELITTSNTLKTQYEIVIKRVDVIDERLTQIGSQATQTAEQASATAKKVEELEKREDKVGLSEAEATDIAKREAQSAACAVATKIAAAAQAFTDGIKSIDCGQADHTAFMAAGASGDDFTPTDGGGSSSAESSSESSSTTTETSSSVSSESTSEVVAKVEVQTAEPVTGGPAPTAGAASF